ncbi:nitroreductase family protein [Marinomonas rhizomae]|uniref:nitroreductase family protein n=1 Tax=Marinomonas rhizomae TaxID=491948 RepID=UPI002102F49C|nr:nitroreductase family protein [Marinomonas rhizomae]UTW00955.1 nitroreductase family protein [Marinomonas rhizomae]
MNSITNELNWDTFQSINHQRRAIRDFCDKAISEDEIYAILTEAQFAPSSVNLQPYQFHWIRDSAKKAKIAEFCNGQKAAQTAAEIIVIVANTDFARDTIVEQLANIDRSTTMPDKSKDYHRKNLTKFDKILKIGGLPIWTPIVSLLSMLRPCLSLLPIGHLGSRHWAARNATFAAQTLMLSASAKGIDSCPMEGFSSAKLSKLLNLPRGAVIPVVIALGYRSETARVEEQSRRSLKTITIEH